MMIWIRKREVIGVGTRQQGSKLDKSAFFLAVGACCGTLGRAF
jgi:hypothetical protein